MFETNLVKEMILATSRCEKDGKIIEKFTINS